MSDKELKTVTINSTPLRLSRIDCRSKLGSKIMNKISKFLFLTFLSIFFPLSVSANSIFSCEAKRVSGDNQMLKPNVYENIIYPTMVISNEDDTILYVYSEHGRKWENNY